MGTRYQFLYVDMGINGRVRVWFWGLERDWPRKPATTIITTWQRQDCFIRYCRHKINCIPVISSMLPQARDPSRWRPTFRGWRGEIKGYSATDKWICYLVKLHSGAAKITNRTTYDIKLVLYQLQILHWRREPKLLTSI